MNWAMVGAVGELLGAVVVVFSLVYLARQVRDGSDAAQRTQYFQLNRETISFAEGVAHRMDWGDVAYRGMVDRSSLEPKEIFQFNAGMLGLFRSWEAAYMYAREGGVHERGAEGLRSMMSDVLGYPGAQTYWEDRQHWFSADFRAEVDLLIRGAEPTMLRSYGVDV